MVAAVGYLLSSIIESNGELGPGDLDSEEEEEVSGN